MLGLYVSAIKDLLVPINSLYSLLMQAANVQDASDIPDVKKFFLSPDQCAAYRDGNNLIEMTDKVCDYPNAHGVHINICNVQNQGKDFIVHACFPGSNDELNMVYSFVTMIPNLIMLEQMLLQDFSRLLFQEKTTGYDSIH